MNLIMATVPIVAILGGCVGSDIPSRETLRNKLEKCAGDESCYIKFGKSRRQAIVLQQAVVQNAIDLCYNDQTIMTLLPFDSQSESQIIFADCIRHGKKKAQVSAWYHHGEIRDLTLEVCGEGECNTRFSPI